MFLFLFFFTFFVFSSQDDDAFVVVHTSKGYVRGRRIIANYSTATGLQEGIGFLSIPFAEPPVGRLRFRPAVPKKSWEGLLDATKHRAACISDPVYTYKTDSGGPISEDCLHANVFTNDYCLKHKNCSVLVAIHGGGYIGESMASFKEEIIVNNFVGQGRNVVVVSFNYRLGLFGMINLGEKDGELYKTNLLVRDSIDAFKWVKSEITNFGGNWREVTAFGHSAGGALVQALSRSNHSRGLFKRKIIMSGPALSTNRDTNSKVSLLIAKKLDCAAPTTSFPIDSTTLRKIIECLRSKPAVEILNVQNSASLGDSPSDWGGIIVDNELFNGYWEENVGNGNLAKPTLMGTVAAELRESNAVFEEGNFTLIPDRLHKLCEALGYLLAYKEPEIFVATCDEFYSNKDSARYITDDQTFYMQVLNSANFDSGNEKDVFVYSFTYTGVGAAFNKYNTDSERPSHSEEFIYIFGTHRGPMTDKDYEIERIMTGYLTDFTNFGNPTPKSNIWPKYNSEKRDYFEIDFDENLNQKGPQNYYYTRANNFWVQFAEKSAKGMKHLEHQKGSLDVFSSRVIIEFLGSTWRNVSMARGKSMEAMRSGLREMNGLIQHQKNLQKWKKWLLTDIDLKTMKYAGPPTKKTHNDAILISGCILGFSVILIALVKMVNYFSSEKML